MDLLRKIVDQIYRLNMKENIVSPENMFFSGKKLFLSNDEELLFGKTKNDLHIGFIKTKPHISI